MRIAIYCTADDKFIVPAIVALQSIRRFHDYDMFVLSGKLKEENIKKLEKNNIRYIESDKHLMFSNNSKWPNVSFLMLAGPEILHDMGYDYSLGIDADTLCVRPLDIEDVFTNTKDYSGISNQGPLHENFKDLERIKMKYGLTDQMLSKSNTNCGMVFWNNKAMKEFDLWEKCEDAWVEGLFVAVDQSLFALVSVPLHCNILEGEYNYRLGNKLDRKRSRKDVRVFHYTGKKPWDGYTLCGRKWRRFKKQII